MCEPPALMVVKVRKPMTAFGTELPLLRLPDSPYELEPQQYGAPDPQTGQKLADSEVAVRAESFDMNVLGYDPYISEAAAREVQVELVPLEKLLAESDALFFKIRFRDLCGSRSPSVR